MEYFDIYNKNREKTGRTQLRGTPLKKDEYRTVIHICIFSSDGKMLIQQRQPSKHSWPDMWDISVGGGVISGENSRAAAGRELWEELGIRHDFFDEAPFFTVCDTNVFDDYFLLKQNVDLHTVTLQSEEVSRVRWAAKGEILQAIDSGVFVPYHKALIQLLFESCGRRGAFSGR